MRLLAKKKLATMDEERKELTGSTVADEGSRRNYLGKPFSVDS